MFSFPPETADTGQAACSCGVRDFQTLGWWTEFLLCLRVGCLLSVCAELGIVLRVFNQKVM
jgi:hypothetical protein